MNFFRFFFHSRRSAIRFLEARNRKTQGLSQTQAPKGVPTGRQGQTKAEATAKHPPTSMEPHYNRKKIRTERVHDMHAVTALIKLLPTFLLLIVRENERKTATL